ncbi:Adenosine deaminase-related growth factor [Trichoderma simmonsii]|uniref:adenosine deaminase n=1 Tax=Trichoderma simmonsii TaxID=1491479 RepID=A0A8G0LNG9_9HYPO|nr:Adenosine deaminase-related growth factor [Trichoderma simmonsii]
MVPLMPEFSPASSLTTRYPSSPLYCSCFGDSSSCPTSLASSMGSKFSSFRLRVRGRKRLTMWSTKSKAAKHHADGHPRQRGASEKGDASESDGDFDKVAALELIKAHDSEVDRRRSGDETTRLGAENGSLGLPLDLDTTGAEKRVPVPSKEEYDELRKHVFAVEQELSFDARCRSRASELEMDVDAIIRKIREKDDREIYATEPKRRGYHGQMHERFAGDHFLSNVDLINKTKLFEIASKMPKGAHLHIHFNACLPPNVLLGIANGMDRMFVSSTLPLIHKAGDEDEYENFNKCEIQFSIMNDTRLKDKLGNPFSSNYISGRMMKFSDFRRQFSSHYTKATVDEWLLHKLMFEEQETHNPFQTASGAWEKFNGRTRMMKGLFNYEKAYREYTRLCLKDFVRDNIQYAEIRPNFMQANQLYTNDGNGMINNEGIMEIIIDEVKKFQKGMAKEGPFFGGLKVIYCTPRSMDRDKVKYALNECMDFKKKWPQWIAGFDLVGEEAKGYPIKEFVPELLEFKRECAAQSLDIPFLFHCGETLDMGTDTDGNLVDALLLGSKRIGHGFALAKHPYVMQQMKAKGICLELCPISNEILGLTPRVGGHAMYQLLANNVHCTVSSDNGALFRSSLSHDFYQVMVGKADMGLFGWKQLAMWSIDHACLNEEEREIMRYEWNQQWNEFLEWVKTTYGDLIKDVAKI